MGYYFAPKFRNKEEGQICKECNHTDCQDSREALKIPCTICGKSIKPGDAIYFDKIINGKVAGWSHFHCVHENE